MSTMLWLLMTALLMGVVLVNGDMMRKSIVFDPKTPKVFYCPQEKPTDLAKMIVRARPLEKLCEFDGEPIPKNYHSDCYNDIDESEYACAEKARILLRLNPPNETDATTTTTSIPTPDAPEYIKNSKKGTSSKSKSKKY